MTLLHNTGGEAVDKWFSLHQRSIHPRSAPRKPRPVEQVSGGLVAWTDAPSDIGAHATPDSCIAIRM